MKCYTFYFGVLVFIIMCASSAYAQAPEINIVDIWGTDVLHGSTYDLGTMHINTTAAMEFEVQNLGNAPLDLNGTPMVDIKGTGASAFTVMVQPTSPIGGGNSSGFTIYYNMSIAQTYTAIVSIANNDTTGGENPYEFTLTATGINPIMNVKHGSISIPRYTGFYDFNYIGINHTTQAITFTIENIGTSNLELTGTPNFIEIFGPAATMFTINQTNTTSPILPGGSTTFEITFTPIMLGYKEAIIEISSNDALGVYTFILEGNSCETTFDFNNDGYNDIIVGAQGANYNGTAYIFFGGLSHSPIIDASNADVTLIGNNSSDDFGISVSSAGDVNNDGIDDVIVGAWNESYNGTQNGCAYVFFGETYPPSTISASNADVKFYGGYFQEGLGFVVSGAGDINGDGIDDIMMNAPNRQVIYNDTGCVYILFGRVNWLPEINVKNCYDVVVEGSNYDAHMGNSLKCAGDVNNDGIDDIIIGCAKDSITAYKVDAGAAFIFLGRTSWYPYFTGANAEIAIYGDNVFDYVGLSVSGAGDVNGDGCSDVIVGSHCDTTNGSKTGAAYILFGNPSWVPLQQCEKVAASNANVMIIGENPNDFIGDSVNNVGDINNDGYDDVIVGARVVNDGGTHSGAAYVFFGKDIWNSPTETIDAANARIRLIGADSFDEFGSSVGYSNDFNGDGLTDIIVGAIYDDDGGFNSGCVFVFLGKDNWSSPVEIIDASNAYMKIVGEDQYDWIGRCISGD